MLVTEQIPRLSDLPESGSRVHLLGAAGAGMRALAAVLIDGGWEVTGSDRDTEALRSLSAIGLTPVSESDSSAGTNAALVIRSSAVPVSYTHLTLPTIQL